MSSTKAFTSAMRDWAEVFMARSMREWMRYVKSTELSMPQFSIMMKLYYRGRCGISDVSAHLDVTPAGASQLVDGLVQKGYLERTEAEHDRRVKQISLTRKGQALIEKGIEVRNQWMDLLATRLTPEQRQNVIAAVERLAEAARKLEAEG
jgi:DNA-binding MarR family transcriptional regulator